MQYFSEEYFRELALRLNADADWGKKAAATPMKVLLTVSDMASSYMLEVANGIVTPKKATAEDPADFKFEAPYEVWGRIALGQTDFNTAVLTGKMKFKGSLPKILALQPQMTRLTQVASAIGARL